MLALLQNRKLARSLRVEKLARSLKALFGTRVKDVRKEARAEAR